MNRVRRYVLSIVALTTFVPALAMAQSDTVKIGLILPMTGPVSYTHLTLPTILRV